MNKIPIDIVLPWVDDSDVNWQNQYSQCAGTIQENAFEKSNVRFQSWDNLNLWFRTIETTMPWVNKIFLITAGQRPDFLDPGQKKLNIIYHKDFIPDKYLPTFNSNTIEMNLHRIPELSENFILFSDDVFPLEPLPEEYFFYDDLPCDEAIENIITTTSFGAVSNVTRYTTVNNMFIINRYFKKREVQKRYPEQWFNEEYGERLERTKACEYWYDFPGFYDHHMANPFKKSTLAKLWEIEPRALDRASHNKFRGYSDVSQYLIRYWQLCEGNFHPRRTEGKVFFPTIDTYQEVVDAIDNRKYPMICFNENCTPEEFEVMKRDINAALERRFPVKSSFEK